MNGDRSEIALARIEAALARLDSAARRPQPSGDGNDTAQLHRKHEQLRAAVTQSLRQLDALIGEGQR
jgi:hypothetical protein